MLVMTDIILLCATGQVFKAERQLPSLYADDNFSVQAVRQSSER